MVRSVCLALIVLVESAVLFLAGVAALWWSQDLMIWLIWKVGEEYALGPENVIRLENGGTLLTNPGAMFSWMIPIWALGFVQIASAFTLIGLWSRRRSRRGPAPKEE
jgi:hypothetical protein